MIKPFKDIEKHLRNQPCTTRYVHRVIRRVLGKFNLSIEGGELEETGDGGLHIKVGGSGTSSHPFKATSTGGIVTVEPGLIHSNDYTLSGNPLMFFIPVIAGVPLSTVPAPTLSVSTTGTRYVCLAAVFDRLTGSCKSYPWAITIQSTPRTTPLIRSVGSITGQDSLMDIVLAKIVDGAVVADGVSGSLFVGTSINTIHFGAA